MYYLICYYIKTYLFIQFIIHHIKFVFSCIGWIILVTNSKLSYRLPISKILISLAPILFFEFVNAKIFDKCELATLLGEKYNMTKNEVKNCKYALY